MKHALLVRLAAVLLAAIGLFSASALAADASASAPGPQVGTVAIPAGYAKKDVRELIALCLTAREWSVKDKSDDYVVGYLNHRGVEATLTLSFDDKLVTLNCDAWKVDKAGKRLKPDDAKTWVANIKKDLAIRFAKAAGAK